MTSVQKEERYGPVVMECVSRSRPDKAPYQVRLKGGIYFCNCKGWIFNKASPKRCRHTDEAIRLKVGIKPLRPEQQAVVVLCSEFPWVDAMSVELKSRMEEIIRGCFAGYQDTAPVREVPVATFVAVRRIVFDD